MASLFRKTKSKTKSFEHSSDVALPASMKIDRKKPAPVTIVFDSDDDDDDDSDGISTSKSTKRKAADSMVEVLDDDDADYKAQIQAELAARLKNSATASDSKSAIEKTMKSPKQRDDKVTKKAKVLLTDLAKSKKTRSLTSAGSVSEPEIIDLDDCIPTFVVPKVVPASQRIAAADRSNSVNGLTLNQLHALAGSSATAGAAPALAAEPEKPQCKIRTRLNGVHERKWKVAVDEPFAQIKARLADVYGLKATDIKFEFDGDGVKDTETPQSLDLQDDDLVDAKINKALYEAAVKCADSSRIVPAATTTSVGASSGSSSSAGAVHTSTAPAAPATVEADKPSLRIRTRLNGKHLWKWKIVPTDPFTKLRANLVSLYGLQSGEKVSLEFDGEAVKDAQCPADLDVEDENIIDVKIDKAVYDRAVATAGPSK